jgi:glycosyltransferase involved in cell wall biosynthesis
MKLIFNGVTLIEGTGGIVRYARAALAALAAGPKAEETEVWLPSALAARAGNINWPIERIRFYTGPHPHRGFSFNQIFWMNCLAWRLRRERSVARLFSPVETYAATGIGELVMTAHDCYADRFGDPRKGGRVGLGRRLCVRQMRRARLLSVSRFTSEELATLHGLRAPQVATVCNWLPRGHERAPAAEHRARLRAELGLPERFWLYVGGFRRNKNLPLLLRAYAAAAASARDLPSLVLAGKWPERDTVFTGPLNAVLAETGLSEPRLRRVGYVADDNLAALYALAELTICPSNYEGFGYPVIESLAVGTPVIAARAASLPELLGDDPALLFAADDPKELTDRMLEARESAAVYRRPFDETFGTVAGEARFNAALAQTQEGVA